MKVFLKRRLSGEYRQGHILREISQAMFIKVRDSWRSYKEENRPANDARHLQFDSWDWYDKARSTTPERHIFRGIELDGKIQGMVMLAKEPVPSRRAGCAENRVLYVEYLESAPWNNEIYAGETALYKHVGTGLISIAVNESVDAGCGGRLGLHSLSTDQAYSAYRKLGFLDLGFDASEKYNYFELPDSIISP